jgi:hypothetical protein
MTGNNEKRSLPARIAVSPMLWQLLFFAVYFLFIFLYIDPRIVSAFNGMNHYSYVLELTKEFFGSIAATPGGGAKLFATMTVVGCSVPGLGALFFTAIGWALGAAADLFTKRITGRPLGALRFVPAIILLPCIARYEMNLLPLVIGLAGTVFLAALHLCTGKSSPMARAAVFCLLAAASYYLFGLLAILFLALAGIGDALAFRKTFPISLAGALLFGALLWVSATFWFPFDRIFDYGAIFNVKRPLFYLFAFVPVAPAIVYGISAQLLKRKEAASGSTTRPAWKTLGIVGCETMMLLIFGAVAWWTANDWTTKTARELGRVVYLNNDESWDDLLKEKESFIFDDFPKNRSKTALLATNALYRALYHTGRLGWDQFTIPQVASPEPLMLTTISQAIYFPSWPLALDLYTDLGMANAAERFAGEAVENMGPLPRLVYKRAAIQAAKGNDGFALVYCNRLKRMPGWRAAADAIVRAIDDTAAARGGIIERLRECRDTADYVLDSAHEESMFLNLLARNPRNKMAFEYLMAYYMLTRQPEKAARNLYRLPDFKYPDIPALYEELLEIAWRNDSAGMAALPGLPPRRQETIERCNRFLALSTECSRQVPGALDEMHSEFGRSYFYFSVTGVITGAKR